MVAPLFVISLLWERRDWRSSRLFRPRSFTWRIGPFRRTISGTGLASGVLLTLMGIGTLWIGFRGSLMPSSTGWLATLSARLQHYGRVITDALAWIPNWVAVIVLVALVGLLIRRARRQLPTGPAGGGSPDQNEETALKEGSLEQQDA